MLHSRYTYKPSSCAEIKLFGQEGARRGGPGRRTKCKQRIGKISACQPLCFKPCRKREGFGTGIEDLAPSQYSCTVDTDKQSQGVDSHARSEKQGRRMAQRGLRVCCACTTCHVARRHTEVSQCDRTCPYYDMVPLAQRQSTLLYSIITLSAVLYVAVVQDGLAMVMRPQPPVGVRVRYHTYSLANNHK